jgi:hypothetical protein
MKLTTTGTTGKCYVCKKSTKLNIHQKCGELAEAKGVELTGFRKVTVAQNTTKKRNANKKKYVSGKLPAFCYL